MNFMSMMKEGGVFAYISFAMVILNVGISVLAVVIHALPMKKKKRLALISVGSVLVIVSFVAISLGALGYAAGMTEAELAVASASEDVRLKLMEYATEIALIPLKISLANIAPFLFGLVSIIRGLNTPKA